MRLLLLLLCCLGTRAADNQAQATDNVAATKISSAKTTLNSIPSAPAQKQSFAQQQQTQQQYIPQYTQQKPTGVGNQLQQLAGSMLILPQSGHQSGHQSGPHGAIFQQAVNQLLSYYQNNPQARYQLLQQQGGLPHGTAIPSSITQNSFPSAPLPSGALHVIQGPQLESSSTQATPVSASGTQHASASPQTSSGPQPFYAIPAQSLGILAQIAQQNPGALAQAPVQQAPIQLHALPQQLATQLYNQALPTQHFPAQIVPQFGGQFSFPAQFSTGFPIPAQHQVQSPLHTNIHGGTFGTQSFGGQAFGGHGLAGQGFATQSFGGQGHVVPQPQLAPQTQLAPQHQFALKQSSTPQILGSSDFLSQADRSNNNLNTVVRTAYVKG